MRKGGFVLRMVALVSCVGFWVLTLNWELNNGNLNCLNPRTQGPMGCWSSARVAATSVTDCEKASAKLLKLPHFMANSTIAFQMQGRKGMGKVEQSKHSRTITQSATTSSAEVRKKYVASRICKLIHRIRQKRGNLINFPTCPILFNRNAQSAGDKTRARSR